MIVDRRRVLSPAERSGVRGLARPGEMGAAGAHGSALPLTPDLCTRRGRGRRRGITLVEMLAAMAALLIVMGVVATLITALLGIESSGRDHAESEAQLARVAHFVRADVRAATVAQIAADPNAISRLTLKQGESGVTVEYRLDQGDLIRVESAGKATKKQERFRLPPRSSPRFERIDPSGRPFVALVVDRRSRQRGGGSVVRPFRVEASLGADARFEKSKEAAK